MQVYELAHPSLQSGPAVSCSACSFCNADTTECANCGSALDQKTQDSTDDTQEKVAKVVVIPEDTKERQISPRVRERAEMICRNLDVSSLVTAQTIVCTLFHAGVPRHGQNAGNPC